jgi:hypothetical protein
MKFTRHARNRLRHLAIITEQVEARVARGRPVDAEPEGRPRYIIRVGGRRVRVVVAADDPQLVVTVHDRKDDAS